MSHANIDIGVFLIKLDKPGHRYRLDEPIQGKVYLKLRSEIISRGLYLNVIGKLGVFWYEESYTSNFEHNEPFMHSKTFLDEKIEFLKPAEGHESMRIEAGDHEFDFSFCMTDFSKQIEVDALSASSKFPFSSEHEFGDVRYMLTGVLKRSALDFDYHTLENFKIISGLSDQGEMHKYFVPYKCENLVDKSTFSSATASANPGKINLKAFINKTAFTPGETIDCILKMENDNMMRKFSKLYVKIIQTATFHSTEPSSQYKTISKEILSLKQTTFENHKNMSLDELIQIPSNVDPPSTLHPSHHIQYKYTLKIELYSSLKLVPLAPSQVTELSIPIVIHNKFQKETPFKKRSYSLAY